jgi:hypothetical protein
VGRADGTPEVGSGFATDEVGTYRPTKPKLDLSEWTLVGDWRVEDERGVAAGADSQIRLRYAANEAYLVMAPGSSGPKAVKVTVDGKPRPDVTVDGNRLYTVASDEQFGEHELVLTLPSGVEAYAFTFG